jgi:hypothetical protein
VISQTYPRISVVGGRLLSGKHPDHYFVVSIASRSQKAEELTNAETQNTLKVEPGEQASSSITRSHSRG